MLKLYNTLSRQKEDFKPLKGNKVKMYTCGPTVYSYIHIGNYTTYLFSDILKRYLQSLSYQVYDVMNITDVDDKTIKGSIKANKTLTDFTKKYEQIFYEELTQINILKAKKYPHATHHVKDIIKLIKKLELNGFAYQADDKSVYFDISEFKSYGKLANLDHQALKSNTDGRMKSDEYHKDDATDFALWKAYTQDDGDTKWNSPWGSGRPGWHIECSAMIMKLLGEQIDIHIGGEDLIFPHHQNEIAQTEAVTGKQFVKYWLHKAHLKIDNQKMSKSLGNIYRLNDITKAGLSLMAFRYLIVTNHYRQPLNFTQESLCASAEALNKIYNFVERINSTSGNDTKINKIKKLIVDNKKQFTAAMDDDLNTPQAIASLFTFINEINRFADDKDVGKKTAKLIIKHLKDLDKIWAFIFTKKMIGKDFKQRVEKLISKRNERRKNKNFTEADKIREELINMGVEIKDVGDNTNWTIK